MDEEEASLKITASKQVPVTGEAGKTGTWRTFRPVINLDACTVVKKQDLVCNLCWLYCPEGVVTRAIPPEIDLDYCKGDGICATECPANAIEMVREKEDEGYGNAPENMEELT
ncbi:MAG TPA: 4Fe-4S binding protein [Candidatus Lokiarchaeia archaeon]|nr:4Fe-4S binding protein [Candidatus Lokiarchaeia archaeon]